MDPLLLLGAGAVVLIGLTLLLVWQAPAESVRAEDTAAMMPQGDTFEDQYTSATADLSAGGVAITTGAPDEDAGVEEPPRQWPAATPATQGSSAGTPEVRAHTPPPPLAYEPMTTQGSPWTVGVGAAAALTLGGAVAGAWLYARWQRRRNTPVNQLRRRFR